MTIVTQRRKRDNIEIKLVLIRSRSHKVNVLTVVSRATTNKMLQMTYTESKGLKMA